MWVLDLVGHIIPHAGCRAGQPLQSGEHRQDDQRQNQSVLDGGRASSTPGQLA